MRCDVSIPDRSVVLDGEGRFCPELVAPDEGAQSYSWDGEAGFIQFVPSTGKGMEWFFDEARMDPFVAAWEANPPPAPATPLKVTELAPATAVMGDPDVTLHVLGEGFTASCVILFNNGAEATVYVSAGELTTIVKPSLASGPWTVPVRVEDGDRGLSNILDFSFTEPEAPA